MKNYEEYEKYLIKNFSKEELSQIIIREKRTKESYLEQLNNVKAELKSLEDAVVRDLNKED